MKRINVLLLLLLILKNFPVLAIDGFVKEELGWKANKFIPRCIDNTEVYEIKDDKLYLKSKDKNLEEIATFTDEKSSLCFAYVLNFLKTKYPLLSKNVHGKGLCSSCITAFIEDFMEEVQEPQKDDIVTYYGFVGSYFDCWKFNHVAVMISDNMVRAKWGSNFACQVVEHKLKIVVGSYGPYLKFYRLKNEFKDLENTKEEISTL